MYSHPTLRTSLLFSMLLACAPGAPSAASESGAPGLSGRLTIRNFHESLVPRGFVLAEDDWNIWCSASIRDENGRIHLFVARWPVKDTFALGWHTTCEIGHYRGDKPEGPFGYVASILKGTGVEGSWRRDAPHNPTVVRLPDARFALLFIANSHGTVGFPANQKIGMMLSSSLDGPWTLAGRDGLVLDVPTDPEVWSHGSVVGVNNPTLLPTPDGRFLLYYKAMRPGKGQVRRMGVAVSDKVDGPYRFEPKPLTANTGTIEDGFAFYLNGEVCLLVTDCQGPGKGGGMIYHSRDGLSFSTEPVRAYEAIDHYVPRWPNPAPGWSSWVLQRPALLLGADGVPTHLYAPCGTPPAGKRGTATFLCEIDPRP